MVKNYDNKPVATSAGATTDERISVVKLAKSGGCVDRDDAFMKSVREAQIRSYFFGNPIPSTASSALSLSATSSGTAIALSPHAQQLDYDSLSIYDITAVDDDDDYDPSTFGLNNSFLPGGIDEPEASTNPQNETPSNSIVPGLGSTMAPTSNQPLPSRPVPLRRLPPSSTSPPPLSLENGLLAITHVAPNASPAEIRDSSIIGFLYVANVDDKKSKLRVLAPLGGRVPSRAIIWGRKWPGEFVGLIG